MYYRLSIVLPFIHCITVYPMYYCLSIVLPFFMSLLRCIIVFLEVFFLRCVILLWNLLPWQKNH